MLTIHSSNRLERLADALAEALLERPAPPLVAETVVVQSIGLRRWLSFALAERMGVAMNIAFPFPTHLVERTFNALLPRSPVSPAYRREVLPWRIHALLPTLWEQEEFAELRRYASGDPLKQWQLAGQIAAVFDRYLAYRPKLLRNWDAGENDDEHPWQSRLWRAIGEAHPSALADQVTRAPAELNRALPSRINVFGLSTLPPFYVELLGELGRRTDVHLFLLSPTREYWGDLRGPKEVQRFRRWCERRGRPAPDITGDEGHPLLASLGRIGREFHEAVIDLTPERETSDFEEPNGTHLLANLQRAILNLEPPTDEKPALFDPVDRSIQVHNCHSPLRELEVLHDQLLAIFEQHPDIEPRHVLVSMPDITSYAPFIDAVFGAPESDSVTFPYSIADRDARSQNEVTDAFLRILELAGSRYTATEVLSVLESPPVAERFELADDDLPLIRRWVAESGIRWGLDAAHREKEGFPPWSENSWRFGLDRLLLGAALPESGAELFEGILPHGDAEGSLAETLGRFITFCATLFRVVDGLTQQARNAEEWVEVLSAALGDLCASEEDFAEVWRETAQMIEAIADSAKLAKHAESLPFAVIRDYLASALAESDRGNEFLRGGITFCSLKPMRAIPHRVVALLGLNDGAFPRTARPPSFDLTASHPQPGDRTIRDDDRYLFLESILSARDVLYLSHCGQSTKDDSKSPPSVLVVEFLDYLDRAYRADDGRSLHDHLAVTHPLQPFHRSYFADANDAFTFSYSRECAAAAVIAAASREAAPAFISTSTIEAPAAGDVTLERLTKFLLHPTKFFAQETLNLRLPGKGESPEDVEPIALDSLEQYGLRQSLADAALSGADPDTLFPSTRASGTLPQGFAGEMAFDEAAREAKDLAAAVALNASDAPVPVRTTELKIGEWRIRGHISGRRGDLLVRVRAAKIGPKDLLRAWVAHLFACTAEPDAGLSTLIIGREKMETIRPVKFAEAELAKLLGYFATGHSRPLPLFPLTSHAYAKPLVARNKRASDPLAAARTSWFGSGNDQYGKPEADDEWNAIIWRPPAEPLNDEWRLLAVEIFRPLFAHMQEDEE